MIDIKELRTAVEQAAAEVGAEGYEIKVGKSISAAAEALKDEISSVTYTNNGGMTVRIVKNKKSGFADSDLVTPDEAKKLVYRAAQNAAAVDDEDEVPLFGGSDSYAEVEEPHTELPSADELKDQALRLQRATYARSSKVVDGTQCYAGCEASESVFISSAGLDLSYSDSLAYAGVYAAVKDGEAADSDYELSVNGDKSEDELVGEAVGVALSKLGAEPVESGKYNIILDDATAASLLSAFSSVFSAKSAYQKVSKFADREGEAVASTCLSIYDDPFHPEKFGKKPFDSEGVAVYRKPVIENGVLKTLLYNRMYAKRMGKETTGNAASATAITPVGLYIEAGDCSSEELLARLGDGLYITGLAGLHAGVNAQSGDFSLQAEGFLVEGGKKTRPVKNITIADNFYTFINKITALSDKVKFRSLGRFGAPEVMFSDIAVSGK